MHILYYIFYIIFYRLVRRDDDLSLLDKQASASGVAGVIGPLLWWRSLFSVLGCMFDSSIYWTYIYHIECRSLPSQTWLITDAQSYWTKLSIFYFSHHQPKSHIYIYISATSNSELYNLISKSMGDLAYYVVLYFWSCHQRIRYTMRALCWLPITNPILQWQTWHLKYYTQLHLP